MTEVLKQRPRLDWVWTSSAGACRPLLVARASLFETREEVARGCVTKQNARLKVVREGRKVMIFGKFTWDRGRGEQEVKMGMG